MDTAPTPKVEQFNQIIRGVVVLAFVFGMVYGFIVTKVVSTESFLIVASVAITWLFKSRDDDKKSADAAAALKASNGTIPPASGAVTS